MIATRRAFVQRLLRGATELAGCAVAARLFRGPFGTGGRLVAVAASLGSGPGCASVRRAPGRRIDDRIRVPRSTLGIGADPDVVALDVPGARPLILVHRGEDRWHAVSATCTHQGCRVDASAPFLTCPCHGSTFTHDGTVVRGPATAPLPRHPATAFLDHIVVDLANLMETR